MEKTLKVLNDLERRGIIERYAIGGAGAALFYMEPILTYDLDVFVLLPETEMGLVTLSPIYARLREKGYQVEAEHVIIEGVPVQFIPAYNDLVEEAVKQAVRRRYEKTMTRVLRLEHLLAIMLQTYRPKDKTRMTQLLDVATVDENSFKRILRSHGLEWKWQEFRRRFYGD
jgi:hypothetical protein